MITAQDLLAPQRAGRPARNRLRLHVPFMGRNGANNANFRAVPEITVKDERLQMSGLGEGETTSEAKPIAIEAQLVLGQNSPWIKWVEIAVAAGLAIYVLKHRA